MFARGAPPPGLFYWCFSRLREVPLSVFARNGERRFERDARTGEKLISRPVELAAENR
jgi:hypothetical protein